MEFKTEIQSYRYLNPDNANLNNTILFTLFINTKNNNNTNKKKSVKGCHKITLPMHAMYIPPSSFGKMLGIQIFKVQAQRTIIQISS